ncbi:MAG: carboxypeptidase regulatory-like domain-containing protein [bacterium]
MCYHKLPAQRFSWFSMIAGYVMSCLVMVSLCMWPCPGQAQLDSSGAIQGQITDPNGQSVADLQVLAMEHTGYGFYGSFLPNSFDPWLPEEIKEELQQQMSGYFYPSFVPYPTIYRTQTQSDGAFLLGGLAAGRYTLWAYDAQGRGYCPTIYGAQQDYQLCHELTGYSTMPVYIPVHVKAGETTGPLHIAMEMGGGIAGRIIDAADGSPIDEAKIQIRPYREEDCYDYRLPFLTDSDANGHFSVMGLSEGEYTLQIIAAEGYIVQSPYVGYSPDTGDAAEPVYTVLSGQITDSGHLTLQQGGVIEGTVTSQVDGSPIADISVFSYKPEGGYGYYPLGGRRTDLNGMYHLSGLEGEYMIYVPHTNEFQGAYYDNTQDSKAALSIMVEAGELIGSIDFQLASSEGKGSIQGQIVDEGTGMALPGVMVYIMEISPPPDVPYMYPPDGDEESTTYYSSDYGLPPPLTTPLPVPVDDQGRFAFSGLTAGRYRLGVFDPEGRYLSSSYPPEGESIIDYYDPEGGDYIALEEHQVIDNIRISLHQGGCLEGQILDGSTPVAGVEVQVFSLSSHENYGYQTPWDVSDTEGKFSLCGVDDTECILIAQDRYDRGYGLSFPADPYDAGHPAVFHIPPGSTISNIVITMNRGFTLQGLVSDVEGNPLAGIQVAAEPRSFAFLDGNREDYTYLVADRYVSYAASREDGSYTFTDLSEGTYEIRAEDPSSIYLPGELPEMSIYSDMNAPDLILTRGGILAGTVTDSDGNPLADIEVVAYIPSADFWYFGGEYPNYPVSGYNYSGFYPLYEYFRTKTKEDGAYEIRGLKEGDYRLEAKDPKGNYVKVEYQGPELNENDLIEIGAGEKISNLNFVLSLGGIIEGRVLDAATGIPIPEVRVEAKSSSAPGYVYSSPTDGQGYYTIRALPTGSYILSASSFEGYLTQYYMQAASPEAATLVGVSPDQTCDDIDFHLQEGASLSGTIRDAATGQALSTACTVWLLDEQGEEVKKTSSDAQGGYTFTGLIPGTYKIEVTYAYGYYPGCYSEEADSPEGCTLITVSQLIPATGYDLSLSPKASISGRVVDDLDGRPLGNKRILAIPASYEQEVLYYGYGGYFSLYDSNTQYVYTGPDGRYTIKHLEEGNYRVLALDPYYIYGSEYYPGVPVDQIAQAGIISLERSEARQGIDFTLQIGGTQSVYNYGSQDGSSSPSYGSYGGISSWSGSLYGGYSSAFQSFNAPTSYSGQTEPPDQPPAESPSLEITSLPEESIVAGRTYTYQVMAQDSSPAGSFTYDLRCRPEGMSINPATGEITWQPKNENAGQSVVQIAVSNEFDHTAFQSFRLRVNEDTGPPEEVTNLQARAGDRQVTLSWTPCEDSAGDLDGLTLYIASGQSYGEGISLDKIATEYTAGNLKSGQAYSFKITTRDLLGNESEGVIASATTRKAKTTSQTLWPSWNAWNSSYGWPGLSGSPLFSLPSSQMTWSPRLDQRSLLWPPSFLTSSLWTPSSWIWADASPYALLPWNNASSLSGWPLGSSFSTPASVFEIPAFRDTSGGLYSIWDPYDSWTRLLYQPILNQQFTFPSDPWEMYSGYTMKLR